jgi:hypothetical protein
MILPGSRAELCFEFDAAVASLVACAGATCSVEGGRLYARALRPSRAVAVEVAFRGVSLGVVLLDDAAFSLADHAFFARHRTLRTLLSYIRGSVFCARDLERSDDVGLMVQTGGQGPQRPLRQSEAGVNDVGWWQL